MGNDRQRVPAIDAIRGMALFGILYVHLHDGYNGFPSAGGEGWWNVAASWVYGELFLAKAYLIFSFLFGLGFALQLGRAEARGCDFRGRFLWRLVLLFGFGIVNTLFYGGDILMLFAVFGAVLLPFWRVRSVFVVVAALLLSAQCPFVFDALSDRPSCLSAVCGVLDSHVLPMPDAAASSWATMARWNVTDGLWARLSYVISSGRLGAMLAMFLWGMLVGRNGFYGVSAATKRFWRAVLLIAAAAWVVLQAAEGVLPLPQANAWSFVFSSWENMAGAAMFLGACFLTLERPALRQLIRPFCSAGRASLSCYIAQNIVGTLLLFGWGMGLGARLTAGGSALLAASLFAVQSAVCFWWFRHYRFGPLEWLWRSATYGHLQPMRPVDARAASSR